MNFLFSISLALGALFFASSCHYWGPNQQAGTVIGGVVGAGLGAVIGSHSGRDYHHGRGGYRGYGGYGGYGGYYDSGNAGEGALIGAAVGAIAGNLLGASADQQQYYGNRYYPPPKTGMTNSGPAYGQFPPRSYATSNTNFSVGVGVGGYPGYGYGYPYYRPYRPPPYHRFYRSRGWRHRYWH